MSHQISVNQSNQSKFQPLTNKHEQRMRGQSTKGSKEKGAKKSANSSVLVVQPRDMMGREVGPSNLAHASQLGVESAQISVVSGPGGMSEKQRLP